MDLRHAAKKWIHHFKARADCQSYPVIAPFRVASDNIVWHLELFVQFSMV
jgi:hypothetical protein